MKTNSSYLVRHRPEMPPQVDSGVAAAIWEHSDKAVAQLFTGRMCSPTFPGHFSDNIVTQQRPRFLHTTLP